MVTKRTKR